MLTHIISWAFCAIVFLIGLLNLFLIHPVPGLVYLFLSLFYFPPAKEMLRHQLGFRIPLFIKIILGVFIIWFTLGISDLAELFGL
mgnify:CR=1 FL=1